MLLRYDILINDEGRPQVGIIPTPIPTPDGVSFMTPEILPEGDFRNTTPPPTARRSGRRRRT